MTDGNNGRDGNGRFGSGNQAAKGRTNPHARRVVELRSAFMDAVTPDDIQDVVAALFDEAKSGNVAAIREYLSRALGPAEAVDLLERLEELESALERLSEGATP
jgi:hypothetical protein